MTINPNTAIRFNENDKAALREVARRLCGGNQSETLRALIRTAYQVLKENDAKTSEPENHLQQEAITA